MPLRIIESNKGGKILVDDTSRTYGLVLTKKTNPPHIWYCKNKNNKSIKCQATCVTNGLDPKLSSITRNAGAHKDLCISFTLRAINREMKKKSFKCLQALIVFMTNLLTCALFVTQ